MGFLEILWALFLVVAFGVVGAVAVFAGVFAAVAVLTPVCWIVVTAYKAVRSALWYAA